MNPAEFLVTAAARDQARRRWTEITETLDMIEQCRRKGLVVDPRPIVDQVTSLIDQLSASLVGLGYQASIVNGKLTVIYPGKG